MYVTHMPKVGSVLLFLGASASAAGSVAQKGMLFAASGTAGLVQAAPGLDAPAMTVKAGKLSVTVIEKGFLGASQKIFCVIHSNGRVLVYVGVRKLHVDKLSRNMKAKIRVDALANATLDGTIREIAPVPDSGGRLPIVHTTRVLIDKPLPGLRPGMSALVEFLVSEHDNVISVPVEAIVRYDDQAHVAVKKPDGTFEWREVSLGVSNDRVVEVKQGLKSGEQVAIQPQALLSEKR